MITTYPPTSTPSAHHTTHESGGTDSIKLDDLAAPDDNTDLNVSTSAHGLTPKLPNDATKFLDGTGVYSVPAGGVSGGASAQLPIDAAAIASVGSGDLFPGTSLDGGWSSLQTTALTSIDRSVDGWCILKNTGNTGGEDRGIQRAFAPAGDFTVVAKITSATFAADFQWAGIFIGASTPGNGVGGARLQFFLLRSTSSTVKAAKWAAAVETVVFVQTVDNAALMGPASRTNPTAYPYPAWLRIKRVGSTLTFGISWDGVQFTDLGTTTTISFTVAKVGLLLAEGADTRNIQAVFQYIATTG